MQYGWLPVRFEQEVPLPPGCLLAVAVSGVRAAKTREALSLYNRLSADAGELHRVWIERSGRSDATLFAALASDPEAASRLAGWLGGQARADALRARLEQFRAECFEIIPGVAELLKQGETAGLGELIDRSQAGAERGLGNQVPETTHLQRSARTLGALGASAFGAGFGGSVWALIDGERAESFVSAWAEGYRTRFPDRAGQAGFFLTRAGPPASGDGP
jgi:galactokinase